MRQMLCGVALLIGLLIHAKWVFGADDFRVETTVFAEKNKEPVNHSTTLFHAGVVYDYLSDPEQVAILDQARARFILLDVDRHQKTEIKLDDVATFTMETRGMATKSLNGFLKFAADPKFDIRLDEANDELVFAATPLTYRVKAVSTPNPEIARQYREFSDWYTRLNVLIHPGATPPFARMAVNEELVQRNQMPESVLLTIPKQIALGGRGQILRSEHNIAWRLLQKDLDRIAATGTQMSSFKLVAFNEFRRASQK